MDVVGVHTDDLFVRDLFSRMTMLVPGLVETTPDEQMYQSRWYSIMGSR
jgi:hypothetical protein